MRIGIFTFHDVPNYGAVLQTYALQKTIQKLGHNCQVIDYRNEYFKKIYKPILLQDLKYKKYFLKKLLLIPKTLRRQKKIASFVTQNICLTPETYSKDTLLMVNEKFDCIFAGSDQIWNMGINGNDTSYFLDFVNDKNKKNSYAASFARTSFSLEEEQQFRKLLSDFNRISVREIDGQHPLEVLLNQSVDVVLDPTLLLPKMQWENMVSAKKGKPYLLVYLMSPNTEILSYAMQYAAKNDLAVKYISLYEPFGKKGMEIISEPTVEEWLSLIHNADFLLTNSFHGVAFSIIFKKNFMFGRISDAGKNSRITSLLSILEIGQRTIDPMNLRKMFTPIDYSRVAKKLCNERQRSINYIKSTLHDCEIKNIGNMRR